MGSDLDRLMQRPYRYWYEDGIAELVTGILLSLLALFYYLDTRLVMSGPLGMVGHLVLVAFIVGLFISSRWWINKVKQWITYPRTGYVAYRRPQGWQRWRRLLLAMLVGAMVGGATALASLPVHWSPVLVGLAFSGTFLYQAWRVGVLRLYTLALVALVTGIVVGISGLTAMMANVAFFGFLGLCLGISGGVTLARYLHSTPAPDPAGEE